MSETSDDRILDADILTALDHVLSSPDFEASDRNRRFLRHIVEETIGGRSDRIKAYCIATEVFGRCDDFDPQQDSIVRIEAGRLRRALEHYYLKAGDSARIQIAIPKGTYVPSFVLCDQKVDTPPPPSETKESELLSGLGPRILVANFDQEGSTETYPTIGRTFTRQLIAALTRFTEIFVYGFDTTDVLFTNDGQGHHADRIVFDYKLLGTVTLSNDALHVELLMKKDEDGRFVWAQSFERTLDADSDPARMVNLCAEISGQVARVIALRDGIMDSQARDIGGAAPRHFAGYQKLLDFHDYWRSLDPELFEPLRQNLEATIVSEPHFAGAYACLSMVYSNAARYGYDISAVRVNPLKRAMELAQKAIQLAPNSNKPFHARAVAEWFSGMPSESLATLEIARSLNPNDPEILAELGFRSAMRMDWDVAVPLLEEAYIRNPLQTGQYRMGLFFFHFSQGRYERALRESQAIGTPGIAYIHLTAAAALSRLNRFSEARERLKEAGRLAPDLNLKLYDDLVFRQIHPKLINDIMNAVGSIDPNWTPELQAGHKRAQ